MSTNHEEIDTDILQIDKYNLDVEWGKQPKLFHHYAEMLAEAREDLERAKMEKDFVFAELDLDVRRNPDKYNIPKATESTINSAILVSERYQKVQLDEIKKKRLVADVQAIVDGLEHRKKALEYTVQLFTQDYFSEPKLPKGSVSHEAMDDLKMRRRKKEQDNARERKSRD